MIIRKGDADLNVKASTRVRDLLLRSEMILMYVLVILAAIGYIVLEYTQFGRSTHIGSNV